MPKNPPNLKITKDRFPALEDILSELRKKEALVGVPGDKGERSATDGDPVTNAELAFIHDQGSPARNIPARPFMAPGIEAAKEKIADAMIKPLDTAFSNQPVAPQIALERAGLIAQAAIRTRIRTGEFAPLSPVTINRRKARGVTRTKPLIDTGQLLAAINYVVREKGED